MAPCIPYRKTRRLKTTHNNFVYAVAYLPLDWRDKEVVVVSKEDLEKLCKKAREGR